MIETKDLNTYANDICFEHMPRFEGLRLVPSKTAGRELAEYGFDADDCREILEMGYSPRKRAEGTVEKWLDFGRKTYSAVVVKVFSCFYNEEVYLIKHFGMFARKRFRRQNGTKRHGMQLR